jgi:hypothetical protein
MGTFWCADAPRQIDDISEVSVMASWLPPKQPPPPVVLHSDEEDSEDIPLLEIVDSPAKRSALPSSRSVHTQPPLLTLYRALVTSCGFGKKMIRLFDNNDRLVYTAEPDRDGYAVLTKTSFCLGRIEMLRKNEGTLILSAGSADKEVIGVHIDAGLMRLVLMPQGKVYPALGKDTRLSSLAGREKPPDDAFYFASDVAQKGVPFPDVPQCCDQTEKCFVVHDGDGYLVLMIYKMADRFFSVHASDVFGPIGALACAVPVLHK